MNEKTFKQMAKELWMLVPDGKSTDEIVEAVIASGLKIAWNLRGERDAAALEGIEGNVIELVRENDVEE
jgi:hypothetical protein